MSQSVYDIQSRTRPTLSYTYTSLFVQFIFWCGFYCIGVDLAVLLWSKFAIFSLLKVGKNSVCIFVFYFLFGLFYLFFFFWQSFLSLFVWKMHLLHQKQNKVGFGSCFMWTQYCTVLCSNAKQKRVIDFWQYVKMWFLCCKLFLYLCLLFSFPWGIVVCLYCVYAFVCMCLYVRKFALQG